VVAFWRRFSVRGFASHIVANRYSPSSMPWARPCGVDVFAQKNWRPFPSFARLDGSADTGSPEFDRAAAQVGTGPGWSSSSTRPSQINEPCRRIHQWRGGVPVAPPNRTVRSCPRSAVDWFRHQALRGSALADHMSAKPLVGVNRRIRENTSCIPGEVWLGMSDQRSARRRLVSAVSSGEECACAPVTPRRCLGV